MDIGWARKCCECGSEASGLEMFEDEQMQKFSFLHGVQHYNRLCRQPRVLRDIYA